MNQSATCGGWPAAVAVDPGTIRAVVGVGHRGEGRGGGQCGQVPCLPGCLAYRGLLVGFCAVVPVGDACRRIPGYGPLAPQCNLLAGPLHCLTSSNGAPRDRLAHKPLPPGPAPSTGGFPDTPDERLPVAGGIQTSLAPHIWVMVVGRDRQLCALLFLRVQTREGPGLAPSTS